MISLQILRMNSEFIAYDCPRICEWKDTAGAKTGRIDRADRHEVQRVLTAGMDSMFESNTYVFRDLKKSLREIIAEEKGMVTLNSQFKSIDIRDISDNYRS